MKPILVILSSAKHLTVYPDAARQRKHRHPTGFFLSELAVPGLACEAAGYEVVYASPSGDPEDSRPDRISLSAEPWFDSYATFQQARAFLQPPISLAIRDAQADDYAGIFIPGGHAPLEDLSDCEALGRLLVEAACKQKPIAAICHGPAALLSAGHFFSGRRVTCFSKAEEEQEEPGQDNLLGGYVPFYLDEKLEERGIEVVTRAPWKPHVEVDELVTGQNPMSDKLFARGFLELLGGQ